MRILLAIALALVSVALGQSARAQTIPFASGWLAECTAIGPGTCTEQTAAGYARQPMTIALTKGGLLVRSLPFAYASAVQGPIAGRALYDAPNGGNLILVSPLPAGYVIPVTGGDREDVGSGGIALTGQSALIDPTAFSGVFAPAATIGTNANGTVYAGIGGTIRRGVLYGAIAFSDPAYVQPTLATGFSVQLGNATSTVDVLGAGTLATGTILLPLAPVDGDFARIECAVTVTALTVTPATGETITGTAPSSCGPNASHMLHYHAASATWSVLF